jgi:addiction module RelE/StbE family toxin
VRSIFWSPRSVDDLAQIREFISRDSERYADLVVARIVAAVERLEDFPESGRIVPEFLLTEIREVLVPPYRIVYRVGRARVEVVTVVHAARQFRQLSE